MRSDINQPRPSLLGVLVIGAALCVALAVRGQHGANEATVVGAVLKQGATIVRGKKRIGLDQIHAGDKVTLKYVKTRDGLAVRSIVLHRN